MARIRVPLGEVSVSRMLCEVQLAAARTSQQRCLDGARREAQRAIDATRRLRLYEALQHADAAAGYYRAAARWDETARRYEDTLASWPMGVQA